MALNASALITAAAATEYQHYVKVREHLRHPAPSTPSSHSPEPDSGESVMDGMGFTTTMGEAAQAAKVGSGQPGGRQIRNGVPAQRWVRMSYGRRLLAAVIGLHVCPEAPAATAPAKAPVRIRGWISLEAADNRASNAQVDRAREAWHRALLERGILPFLREALAEPGTSAGLDPASAPAAPTGRLPKAGYDRPGFTSPDEGRAAGPRPSFNTSPGSGRPERPPE